MAEGLGCGIKSRHKGIRGGKFNFPPPHFVQTVSLGGMKAMNLEQLTDF
jgi:hypothetical protein